MNLMFRGSEISDYIHGKPSPRYEAAVKRLKEDNRVRIADLLYESSLIDNWELKMLSLNQILENSTDVTPNTILEDMAHGRIRVPVGEDESGKPKFKQVSGSNDAERFLNGVQAAFASGYLQQKFPGFFMLSPMPMQPKKEQHPFTAYAQDYFTRYKKNLQPNTKVTQGGWLKQACKFFGDEPIEGIGVSRMQDFVNSIQISKTTGKTCTQKGIKQKLTFIGEIFELACVDKLIEDNPVKNKRIVIGGTKGKGIDPLPRDVLKDMVEKIRTCEDTQIKFYLALMLYSGQRREEALGIRWEDIDFEQCILHIERAITYPSTTPVVSPTKTENSTRDIFMPDELIHVLKPHRKSEGYLLSDSNGQPYKQYRLGKLQKHVCQYTGLPKLDARQLRHSYATMLHEAGVDIKTIGFTMGHTSTKTTNGYIGNPEIKRLQSLRNVGVDHILA